KPKNRQPFFEDDEQYPAASLNGVDAISPKITAGDIRAFYLEHYKPQNMVLFVCGDISKLAISNSIKDHFSSLASLDQENASGSCFIKDPVARQESNYASYSKDFVFDTNTDFFIQRVSSSHDVERECINCIEEDLEEVEEEESIEEDPLA